MSCMYHRNSGVELLSDATREKKPHHLLRKEIYRCVVQVWRSLYNGPVLGRGTCHVIPVLYLRSKKNERKCICSCVAQIFFKKNLVHYLQHAPHHHHDHHDHYPVQLLTVQLLLVTRNGFHFQHIPFLIAQRASSSGLFPPFQTIQMKTMVTGTKRYF